MSRWYQPDEDWPKHSKPWWRETLELARSAGWRLKRLDGHSWGRIACNPDLDKPCKILIFSTGANGESAARDARKTVARCDHQAEDHGERNLLRAAGLLEQAERLLDAADRCLRAADKRAEAEELLNSAASAVTEAEKLLEQAVASEKGSQELLLDAFAALPAGSQLGCPPTTQEVRVLIVEAEAHIDESQQLVDDLPKGPSGQPLQNRIQQVRARMDDLLGRTESG
ncbi:hypothetical protein [Streptomyces goshikiensis]|uniref:hypothetical protein n=1 Tax=Streptomyces goshikiensis TaxID=1942 RepID=UPI0036A6A019